MELRYAVFSWVDYPEDIGFDFAESAYQQDILTQEAEEAADLARGLVPIDSGYLLSTIYSEPCELDYGYVAAHYGAAADYASYVERRTPFMGGDIYVEVDPGFSFSDFGYSPYGTQPTRAHLARQSRAAQADADRRARVRDTAARSAFRRLSGRVADFDSRRSRRDRQRNRDRRGGGLGGVLRAILLRR